MTTINDLEEIADHEVSRAYADCYTNGKTNREQMYERNLDFRSSVTVSREEAAAIMSKYVKGYNYFTPSLINKLPADSRIRLAREGSVCLYVETATELTDKQSEEMKADEFHLYHANGSRVYRLWWD